MIKKFDQYSNTSKVNEEYKENFDRFELSGMEELIVPVQYNMVDIGFFALTDLGEVLTYGENGNDILKYNTLEIYEEDQAADGIDPGEDHMFEPFGNDFKQAITTYLEKEGYKIVEIHLLDTRERMW